MGVSINMAALDQKTFTNNQKETLTMFYDYADRYWVLEGESPEFDENGEQLIDSVSFPATDFELVNDLFERFSRNEITLNQALMFED